MSWRRGGSWLVCALLLLCGARAGADDWPQLGGAPDRAGRSGERLTADGSPGWTSPGAAGGVGETHAGVVVADGVVVTAAADGTLRGLAEDDGRPLWTRALGGADLDATPAAGAGRVVVALGSGRVVCLALETGATVWERASTGGPRAAVAVVGDAALVSLGFPSRRLVCLELAGGATRWQAELPQLGYAPPAALGDLVVVGTDDGAYQARRLGDGAHVWTFATQGRVLLSGATLGAGGAFLLPGGEDPLLYRVDLDVGAWPGANRTVSLADPAPPVAWSVMGHALSTSTPAWTGTRVVVVVRHDYVLDEVAPWWTADRYLARERVVAVDPAAGTIAWSHDLGQVSGATQETIPPLGACAAPALLSDGASAWALCASSLGARARFLRLSDGADAGGIELAGERWGRAAAPALANGRLFVVTAAGAVEARALGNAAPTPPAPLDAGRRFDVARPRLRWSPGGDPDGAAAGLTYEVRVDHDGEVLLDALVTATTVAGALELDVPADLPSDHDYAWRARARDPSGAWSPWSATGVFEVALVPGPVRGLRAASGRDWIELTWTGSVSDFVEGYAVWAKRAGAADVLVGVAPAGATSLRCEGLVAEAEYTVRVVARSTRGVESAPESLVVRTGDRVVLDGAPQAGLLEALAGAGPGATLLLGAGDFTLAGAWALPPDFTLRGQGAHLTRLLLPAGSDGLTLGAGRSTIGALALIGAGPAANQRGLVVEQGGLSLDHVVVARLGDGLRVGGAGQVTADHVTLVRNARGARVQAGALRLSNAVVTRNATGVEWSGGAVEVAYSAVTLNHDRDWSTDRPAQGHVGVFAAFRAEDVDDWREAPGAATIDRGDPAADVGDEPAPHGGRVNLGAFGGTTQAAPTPAFAGSSSSGGCALAPPATARPWPTAGLTLLLLGLLLRRRGPRG